MSAFLLDTHAFLWWLIGNERFPAQTRDVVERAAAVYVSAATAWEIRTKYRLGKLPDAGPFVADLSSYLVRDGFRELPVTFEDGGRAGAFAVEHKDPFDRMLAAQALNHRLTLVSNDTALDAFGIVRIW